MLRSAVEHEWQRELEADRMREKIAAFHAKVRLIANPEGGLPVDKAFIDSLYEDD